MPRRVEAYESRAVAEAQRLFALRDLHIDGQRSQTQVIPGSARSYGVATLNGAGVKGVHDDLDPEALLEVGRAAHVIDVTMGEDEGGEKAGVEAEKLYVPRDLGRIDTRPAVDEDELPCVHEVDRTVPAVGEIGASDEVDAVRDFFRGGGAEHTRWYHVPVFGAIEGIARKHYGSVNQG